MNVKRMLSYFMACSLFFTGSARGAERVLAQDNENVIINSDVLDIDKLIEEKLKSGKQGEVLKEKLRNDWVQIHQANLVTDDGIICACETNISDPIENGFNENGQKVFRRKVEVKSDFYFEETGEHLCGLFLAFYFVYDNEKTWVEDSNLMKDQTYALNKYWKVSANEEIYITPGQCIVSLFSHLSNRESSLKNLERTDEFHADIICLANGEIVFRNITRGSKEDVNKEGLKFTDFEVKSEQVRHNLVREVQETNITQIRDIENTANDMYRYIRRDLNIVCKDNKGNVVADVIVHGTFRYNIETHEVKCLSTHNIVQHGDVDVTSRTGNETRTYGGAYGKIELTYATRKGNKKKFADNLIIKCDPMGNVLSVFSK